MSRKKNEDKTNAIVLNEKKKVKEIIQARADQMNENLQEYMAKVGKTYLTDDEVALIMTTNNAYVNVPYSSKDMEELLEWYKQVVPKLTAVTGANVPTRQQFCQMVGITLSDFQKMLDSDNTALRRSAEKLDDYITDMIYRYWGKGIINKEMAKHQLEAIHGRTVIKRSEVKNIDERLDIDAKRNNLKSFLIDKETIIEAEFEEKENGDDND